MTATSPAGQGRGRPVAFDATARTVFLDALAAGAKLNEAAAKAGVTRNVPAQHAKTDRAFAAALTQAKAEGRAIRAATKPHSESHYKHDQCRAPECRALATAARTARRHAAEEPAETTPPTPLPDRSASSPSPFLLARAS
ncbi:hypothetical protein [Streptomyces sp. DSM 41534]